MKLSESNKEKREVKLTSFASRFLFFKIAKYGI